ncbi:MAG: IS21 family transposase, partial [Trueperaceae bacterium]|nr:IS21 family transposase [Trueperaceae bacterium]
MIDLMTRLKIHNMAEGGALQATIAEKCQVGLRSVERILAEPVPTACEVAANVREAAPRRGRPSKADEQLVEWLRKALGDDPSIMATELLRRSREHGYTGGKSALSELVKRLRPSPKVEPVVRFDGLPGEYAQFDFGEVWVKLDGERREKIVFFAGRLKHSRFMHVVVVPNQNSETVVRSLIECLTAFGGSPKEWVFDNPKTIRLSAWGVEPVVLHRYLRDLVAEYRVIPTFCAPRSGNQKGSVERLVGYSKKSFFLARTFRDRADVLAQLTEWLREVNQERPCDATGVIPEVARQDELRWLAQRPVQATAGEHTLRDTATVTPMGTISWGGTPYFATARRIGAPATLLIRRDTLEILVGDGGEKCVHVRRDGIAVVQRHPGQRDDMLGVVHGRRKQATFRRQCLIELGTPARD